MRLLRSPQLPGRENPKIYWLHLVFYSFTAGAVNAGYVRGAGGVMRKRCERRDARLDPASLVFPTVGISLLEPTSQNSMFVFFFCHVAGVEYTL